MIFDGHGDVWTDVTCRAVDHGERDIFRKHHLHKFQEGGVTGGIFVIWIDPPYDSDPVKRSKQIVKSIKQEMEDSADILNFVKKYDDFEKGTKEGKLNIVTGMEGLSQIGEDIDMINYFYDEVGVRHAMLTWNELNALATGISERTVQNAKRNMGGILGARRVGGQWYNFIKKKQPPEPAS